ncbi:hypothetical protein THRCLA_22459 [Thraustotheca clavata]|uniref:Transmembrane protein n=1 Tax=Thraustotheca clavata TaxID=74557 RepID=A0A1V9Z0N8_9STRA|nr:hypothetical protein THRCLA_22459 [Thraustotheca clavata]
MVTTSSTSRISDHIAQFGALITPSRSKYDVNKTEPNNKLYGYIRIISNLIAVVAILLSVITMLVLLNEGMFERRIIQWNYQNDAGYWRPFGKTCLLSSTGFVLNSCSSMELNILSSNAAWDTTGMKLAETLQVPANINYKVTTCVVGCIDDKNWAELHLVVGYDRYPLCNPQNGSQPIAGMAMMEATSAVENYSSGAYLMTIFGDVSMNQSVIYENTDDTLNLVIANSIRVVIGIDGSSDKFESGINTLISSYPLGPWFVVKSYCISEIIDIGSELSGQQGWSTGLHSNKSIITGWACGHEVNNATELITLQVIFTLFTLIGISGDLLITVKGLKGILNNKPVLTYDILSSMERRKILLLFGTLAAAPALIFVDVSRIYFGTTNGQRIWTLSIVSLGIFFAFGSFFIIIFFQYVPCPQLIRHRLLPLSVAMFVYASIPSIALNINSSYEYLSNTFYNAQGIVFMNVSGKNCSCGAYASARTETATTTLIALILRPIFGCVIASFVFAGIKHFITRKKWFMDVKWAEHNLFLSACGVPRWFSSLPLDQEDTIKMGNRLFCKPSMQARMGYATLVRGINHNQVLAANHEPTSETYYLVNIYGLIAAILPAKYRWIAPPIFCEITDYVYTAPTHKKLTKNTTYHYHIGTCVN